MENCPQLWLPQVMVEFLEEFGVQKNFSSFKLMPAPIRRCAGNTEIHPSWRDAVCSFVIENGLKWRDYLRLRVREISYLQCIVKRAHTQTPPMSNSRPRGRCCSVMFLMPNPHTNQLSILLILIKLDILSIAVPNVKITIADGQSGSGWFSSIVNANLPRLLGDPEA